MAIKISMVDNLMEEVIEEEEATIVTAIETMVETGIVVTTIEIIVVIGVVDLLMTVMTIEEVATEMMTEEVAVMEDTLKEAS